MNGHRVVESRHRITSLAAFAAHLPRGARTPGVTIVIARCAPRYKITLITNVTCESHMLRVLRGAITRTIDRRRTHVAHTIHTKRV